jgi:L,D-transpeptidase YcbB
MLSTSAFMQAVKDLKAGRLLPDSVLVKDSSLTPEFFAAQKDTFAKLSIVEFTRNLEPGITAYHELKTALQNFLPKANLRRYTLVKTNDSLLLPKLVYKRICEEDSLKIKPGKEPDSTTISTAIAKYQKWKKLKADGKISKALVKRLNETDREKFIRIAITLDKYKMLPPLPETYIWVNLPAYYMEVRDGDSVVLRSKIICGKPATRTPVLTSAITDMVTYPQWTIPPGIIKKEVLPALQRNPGYIQSKGSSLVDEKGNEVDPYSINWAKYSKSIPYRVVQGSGDDNALGVIKFNFPNPHFVYLHDTNQRYLFGKSSRALSHGCVRVQQWRELAYYLLRRDSLADSSKRVPLDSLNSWLAQKKKKYIRVRQQLPVFIRYFSCEGRGGRLVLHEDIYEEDKRIREKVFASK